MPPSASKSPKAKGKASTAAIPKQEKRKKSATPEQAKPAPTPEKKKVTIGEAFREKPRRPVGPPEKYDPSFHPASYVELASQGKSRAQICFAWGIHRDTLHSWTQDRKEKPELSDAIKLGDEGRSAWWSNVLTGMAVGQVKGIFQAVRLQVTNACAADYKNKVDFTRELDIEEMEFGD